MSENLKTIRELAEELGVSKKKIHYQVSKLDTDLIQRLDGTIYLDKSAISKIKSREALPENAKKYLKRIEELVGVPIKFIGVGAGREDMIVVE